MNILKENKEKLPIDFLTQFVSNGWNEVGNLKASIEAIKATFKDTTKVEGILNELVDAYLIAIGQAELYMQDKNYIDQPEEIKESLTESAELKEDTEQITEELPDIKTLEMDKEEDIPVEEIQDTDLKPDLDIEESINFSDEAAKYEWFCDFDEPVGEKITDDDLYRNN